MNQPWIHKKNTDLLFILSPPFVIWMLVLVFHKDIEWIQNQYSFWTWLLLIVFIDVAHVYASLFKTYWNKKNYKKQKKLFILVPCVAFTISCGFYILGAHLFWSFLAYVAVFHFIRQQYGFMRLYSRNEPKTKWKTLFDNICIYNATLFPMLYWFLTPNRAFNWFIDDEFLQINAPNIVSILNVVYFIILAVYLIHTFVQYLRTKTINIPKNLLILGTYLSWYFGIVYYNNELIFTAFNVVSHGIPYIGLIYYSEIDTKKNEYTFLQRYLSKNTFITFIFVLLLIAFIEEYIWETIIWQEHFAIEYVNLSKEWYFIWVPLLALPQLTHYILDGFIWKKSKKIRS